MILSRAEILDLMDLITFRLSAGINRIDSIDYCRRLLNIYNMLEEMSKVEEVYVEYTRQSVDEGFLEWAKGHKKEIITIFDKMEKS